MDHDSEKPELMRVFELNGQETVKCFLWPPQQDPDGPGVDCRFQITGLGSEKVRFGRGADGLQATMIALQMMSLLLYDSAEYAAGRLTLHGTRDLSLPELPGLRFGQEGQEKAAVIQQSQIQGIVLMPSERFPRIAFEANFFRQITEVVDEMSRNPDRDECERLAQSLGNIRAYYEEVCRRTGFILPYAG